MSQAFGAAGAPNFGDAFSGSAVDSVTVVPATRSSLAMFAKRCVQWMLLLPAMPSLVSYWVGSRIWGRDRAFLGSSEQVSAWSGNLGVYIRQAFYERTLQACGRDIYFGWGTLFAMPQARVGDRVYLGRRVSVGLADIECEAMLADGVQVLSGGREHTRSHDQEASHQSQPQQFQRIRIGRGAWVGTNAVIMADVGARSIIGAGAVVTKPIPPDCVAVGVPAKVIRQDVRSGRESQS